MFSSLRPAFYIKDEEEKKKKMGELVTEHVVPYLARLNKRFEANGTGYFVGNAVSYLFPSPIETVELIVLIASAHRR